MGNDNEVTLLIETPSWCSNSKEALHSDRSNLKEFINSESKLEDGSVMLSEAFLSNSKKAEESLIASNIISQRVQRTTTSQKLNKSLNLKSNGAMALNLDSEDRLVNSTSLSGQGLRRVGGNSISHLVSESEKMNSRIGLNHALSLDAMKVKSMKSDILNTVADDKVILLKKTPSFHYNSMEVLTSDRITSENILNHTSQIEQEGNILQMAVLPNSRIGDEYEIAFPGINHGVGLISSSENLNVSNNLNFSLNLNSNSKETSEVSPDTEEKPQNFTFMAVEESRMTSNGVNSISHLQSESQQIKSEIKNGQPL